MSKPGRNDPCSCGSGKKYKQCCLGKAEAMPGLATQTMKSAGHGSGANDVRLLFRDACLMQQQGRLDEALAVYKKVVALKPDYAEAYNNMGLALQQQGKLDESAACYGNSIMHKPEVASTHYNLGNLLQDQGRPDEAIASYRKALALKPDYVEAFSNLLLAMQYSNHYSPAETFAEHLRFAERFEAPLKPYRMAHANMRNPEKRLKVGYVSSDFRNHAVAHFMEPILTSHDKAKIEVYCYYNNLIHDRVTERIRVASDHWVPCVELSDEQLAARIRNDGIDILVDLSGHTGGNRLLVFARKPAPLQITWIGYPGTTGLEAMDYRLTDEALNPTGETERFYTETLLRLPNSCVFQPAAESPPANALPALAAGQITFACLNNPVKISQQAIRLWSRILLALPRSRLMLGNATDALLQQKLKDMFNQCGIGEARLVLHPRMSMADYLALHQQIDLALDSFPYNGGTTTSHSLWMGVPVISLTGDKAASRIGSTLLTRVGLGEFVARSEEEYFECALKVVGDLPGLAQIRQTLRNRIAENLNADPAQLTRSLEQLYRTIWREWCDT
ncbi:MAG: tetratricopeptide repeat protein [Gammaproteobacteria bacterium]|nr:tetratricopeptide repeat protein [Gammaproteobacteria bacterium]